MKMQRWMIGAAAAAGAALAGAVMTGMSQDTLRQSNLANSIGLECEVFLIVPHTRDKFTSRASDGMRTRDDLPHNIEGVLSGVSESSITVRNNDKAYWINLDAVAVVRFTQ